VLLDACEGLATCVDRSGLTARQLAAKNGHTQVVQAIDDWIELRKIRDARQLQTEETETALRMAAQHNDVSTLQDLLRQGVDPFAQVQPLFWVTRCFVRALQEQWLAQCCSTDAHPIASSYSASQPSLVLVCAGRSGRHGIASSRVKGPCPRSVSHPQLRGSQGRHPLVPA